MQHANETTVLGSFDGARFRYDGVESRFTRQGAKYIVTTDGPDGKLGSYEVKYTFGVEPLQQYLVELGGGRLQALPFAWDTRPKAVGGQRWYHLYANERVTANDALHWTRPSQNWNHMCAECHSTNVTKGYDPAADRFSTKFSELSVGCEACHGAGSRHIAWADGGRPGADNGLILHLDERRNVTWTPGVQSGAPARSRVRSTAKEVETCAQCHSRRESLSQPFVHGEPLLTSAAPELLTEPGYAADGVMHEEVFTYGSFQQSKMAARGVTCSDCHEPHSGKLRAPGNASCTQCHDAKRYDQSSHHHHDRARSATLCTSCHMPARTYMGIDVRHDHGFRVPRPDLTITTHAPNACNDCHRDRPPAWAAAAVEGWFGPSRKGYQTYGEVFASARDGHDETARLAALVSASDVPAIARATALHHLRSKPARSAARAVLQALHDADPLVRRSAISALESWPAANITALVSPLLLDPVRGVRVEAARVLAMADPSALKQSGVDEYLATQVLNADRAEAQNNLGLLYARLGDSARAEAALRAAIRIEPSYAPSYVNLADLYRSVGRDPEGEPLLRRAIERNSENAELTHALGLLLARTKRYADALPLLERAARLDPKNERFRYVANAAKAAVR